jgi:hypothetical protein
MYYLTSIIFGNKYTLIKEHWLKRLREKTTENSIIVYEDLRSPFSLNYNDYAWWDIIRLNNNLDLMMTKNSPVVHCDLDIIIEKDIRPLIDLDYDFIIATENDGNKAYPPECSEKLGFGVCSCFYIAKPRSFSFLTKLLTNMVCRTYNSYSDQVTLMNYIVNNNYTVTKEKVVLNGVEYTNNIIILDDIKICVLDFGIITRDPIFKREQFANHLNIDNVGGVQNFIRYYYEDLEKLPLTCRCGKAHIPNTGVCLYSHIKR